MSDEMLVMVYIILVLGLGIAIIKDIIIENKGNKK